MEIQAHWPETIVHIYFVLRRTVDSIDDEIIGMYTDFTAASKAAYNHAKYLFIELANSADNRPILETMPKVGIGYTVINFPLRTSFFVVEKEVKWDSSVNIAM